MKFGFLTLFFVVFLIVFSAILFAERTFTVGVSPGTVDLRNVEKSSTNVVSFYITTPSEETLLVKLESIENTLDFFVGKYGGKIYNYSEEPTTSWVKVINNPVELRPSNETLKTIGGVIKGYRQVSFLIEIPKNADSGYHIVTVQPTPLMPSETIGSVGSRVVAVTPVNVLFNIPGNALRKGVILDVESGSYVGDNLEIITYFQNIGTITISAVVNHKLYNKTGEFIKEAYSSREHLKPKEIKVIKTFLSSNGLSLDDYNVSTTVDYTTGLAYKNSTISIYSPPPTALVAKSKGEFNLLFLIIILIFIVIVAIIIYKRIS